MHKTALYLPPIYGVTRYPSDVYQSKNYDDGAMYSPVLNGRYSAMRDGRFSPEKDGRFSPTKDGAETPLLRPGTQQLVGRPSSRINIGTQFADYLRQTDARISYPDINNRTFTPQPVPARPKLRREHTFHGYHQEEMDPFTKQYYTRIWRQQAPLLDLNMSRMGRAGGRWRHVTSCTASSGSHMAFIEGTVKQVDNKLTVPRSPEQARIPYTQIHNSVRPLGRVPSASKKKNRINSVYNDHARNGFKYWYQDQKPMDLGLRKSIGAKGRWLGVPGEALIPPPITVL